MIYLKKNTKRTFNAFNENMEENKHLSLKKN